MARRVYHYQVVHLHSGTVVAANLSRTAATKLAYALGQCFIRWVQP